LAHGYRLLLVENTNNGGVGGDCNSEHQQRQEQWLNDGKKFHRETPLLCVITNSSISFIH
jgi:hypothetical protein